MISGGTMQEVLRKFDWADLARNIRAGTPVLYKKPFGRSPHDPQMFFEILQHQAEEMRNCRPANVMLWDRDRLGLKGMGYHNRCRNELEELLPQAGEKDLASYFARLRSHERYQSFGLYVKKPHIYEPMWETTREFLFQLYQHMEMPVSVVGTDFFMGNYEQTPFGAHWDSLHNLMFMTSGRRTMRLWPEEQWCGEFGHPRDELAVYHDYARYRDQALTFELEEGDLLVWPAHFWHVGEGKPESSISTNIYFVIHGLGKTLHPTVQAAIQDMLPAFNQPGFSSNREQRPHALNPGQPQPAAAAVPDGVLEASRDVANLFTSPAFSLSVHKQWLSKVSSWSLDGILRPRERKVLAPGDTVRGSARFPILWRTFEHALLLGSNGHVVLLPDEPGWHRLVARLNAGEPVPVGVLVDECAPEAAGEGGRLEREAVVALNEATPERAWALLEAGRRTPSPTRGAVLEVLERLLRHASLNLVAGEVADVH
jgi:50S ribosomal protein L16 3-hydroxylase